MNFDSAHHEVVEGGSISVCASIISGISSIDFTLGLSIQTSTAEGT